MIYSKSNKLYYEEYVCNEYTQNIHASTLRVMRIIVDMYKNYTINYTQI